MGASSRCLTSFLDNPGTRWYVVGVVIRQMNNERPSRPGERPLTPTGILPPVVSPTGALPRLRT